ncbi:MAG: hypothetical protein R2795_08890 [Saprospiraceae bacterium]
MNANGAIVQADVDAVDPTTLPEGDYQIQVLYTGGTDGLGGVSGGSPDQYG